MASFQQQIETISNARKASSSAGSNLYQNKLNALKQNASVTAEELTRLLAAQNEADRLAKSNLQQSLKTLYAENSQQALIANWDAKVPVLLMPLRLECRFIDLPNRVQELWLRIYPDDIAVNEHEPLLSENEFAAGKNYWVLLFEAEKNVDDAETMKKNAWEQLKNTFDPNRSVWIARQTVPANWNTRSSLTKKEELQFVSPEQLKPAEWTAAPKTQVLPDKFVVSIFKGANKVYEQETNIVPDTLVLGPDPLSGGNGFTKTDSGITFDKEFSWMSDFEEAVSVGMGVKIQLKTDFFLDPAKRIIDRIVVMGVYLSADPVQSATMLGELFSNHRYTTGLAILPQGTSTNNTETGASGYTKNEDPVTKGYFEINDVPFKDDPLCDGNRLCKTLGIDATIFDGVANADCRDHAEAVIMNETLFPATIGYYFDTLLDRVVNDKYVDILRNFFTQYVTGAGPLPAIRIGDQPYGIVVTSDFPRWKNSVTDADQQTFFNYVYNWLVFFNNQWNNEVNRILYVGIDKDTNTTRSPEDIFLNIIGLEASSVKFQRTSGMSLDLPRFGMRWAGQPQFIGQFERHVSRVRNQFTQLGSNLPGEDFLFTNLLFQREKSVYIPEKNLLDGLPDDETRKLPVIPQIGKNYLEWLKDITDLEKLDKQDMAGAKVPNYLLYLLSRHALLLELRKTALAMLAKSNVFIPRSAFDKTYFNFNGTTNQQRDLTIWEILYAEPALVERRSAQPQLQSLGNQILKSNPSNIKSLKSGFGHLSQLPTSRLERLLTGHLDVLTYRLDAWKTGLFFERLDSNRNNAQTPVKGIYLGAFGYLERLQPAAKTTVLPERLPATLRSAQNTPTFATADNAGLIQAPSLDHAAASALLLAGYRNQASVQEPGAFAVNLTSARIRSAQQILEGVRNGQTIEALLGYQFERACHEKTLAGANLNQFIVDFRNKYPIEHQYNPQEGETSDQVFRPVPYPVVNGLKVAREKNTGTFITIISARVSGNEAQKLIEAVTDVYNNLVDTLDATKDLLLSESVYQAAAGNTARTGAVLEALREGNIPADTGITTTPRRSRFAFNHVLSIHFTQEAPTANPWATAPISPASQTEAGLNSWLAKIIGDPSTVRCSAVHTVENGTAAPARKTISLADLKMQPVDLLNEFGKDMSEKNTDVERRVAHVYQTQTGITGSLVVDIDLLDKGGTNGKSFAEVLPLLRALYNTFSQSRAIDAVDYRPFKNGQSTSNGVDLIELNGRATLLMTQLKKTIDQLNAIVPNSKPKNDSNPANLELLFKQWQTQSFSDERFQNFVVDNDRVTQIVNTRIELSKFDLPDAWPTVFSDGSPGAAQALLAETAKAWKAANVLQKNAQSILTSINTAEASEKTALFTKLIRFLLGANFPVMPKFKFDQPTEVKSSLTDKKQLLKFYSGVSGLPDAVITDDWLQGVAEVRQRSGKWDIARSLAELSGNVELNLEPVQLPYRPNDSWIAVQFPKVVEATGKPFEINTDTLSCAIVWPTGNNVDSLQSGLLIDEWSETIPLDKETTGIAFHYNQPDSMPPQALLLAVHAGVENNWTWDSLINSVTNAFHQAKLRAVEPHHLDSNEMMQHLLPGVVAPVNLSGNNISLDFAVASDDFLRKAPRGVPLYEAHVKNVN